MLAVCKVQKAVQSQVSTSEGNLIPRMKGNVVDYYTSAGCAYGHNYCIPVYVQLFTSYKEIASV